MKIACGDEDARENTRPKTPLDACPILADIVAKVVAERSESKYAKQPNPAERTFESTLRTSA
jgi:hypothetical protein